MDNALASRANSGSVVAKRLAEDSRMRMTALVSALFTLAGTTPTFTWIPDGALLAPEPMWLALWGLALIGFSKTIRASVRARAGQ